MPPDRDLRSNIFDSNTPTQPIENWLTTRSRMDSDNRLHRVYMGNSSQIMMSSYSTQTDVTASHAVLLR